MSTVSGWCNGHPQARPKHEHCRAASCSCLCHRGWGQNGVIPTISRLAAHGYPQPMSDVGEIRFDGLRDE